MTIATKPSQASSSRSIILDYESWYFAALEEFNAAHTKVKCFECNGHGDAECDCCGHINECNQCGGDGEIYVNAGDVVVTPPMRTRARHRKYIISTFYALAKFSGRSYFKQCKAVLEQYKYQLGRAS